MNQEPCTLPAADLAPQTSAHLANGREAVDATGKLRILLLEDRAADAELVLRALQQEGFLFDVNRVWTEEDFLAQLRGPAPDLILADYALPTYDGLSALKVAQRERPEVPCIFVSGTFGEDVAIDALHHGASDCVAKDRLRRLGPAVRRALREVEERRQRQKAEEALRRSESNYREVFNATQDAIFVHDAVTGEALDVNQPGLEMLGYTRAELAQLNETELRSSIGSYSGAEALRLIRLAATEGPQVFEWEAKRKNGERFWTEVTLRGARIGGEWRVVAVVRDLTERRRLEAEREKALADYRMLFDKMIDGFALHEIICDAVGQPVDYRFLSVNPAFEKLTGLNAGKVVGRRVKEVLPQIEPFWIVTYGRVALSGEPTSFDRYESQIGRHYEVTAFCPTPGQFACIVVDVSERKAAEANLRESRRRLLEILEATPAGYFLIDAEGRYRHVNPAWLQMHGLSSPEEIIGKHFSVTQVEGDLKAAEAIVARILGGEHIESGEFNRRLKDGSVGWHSFSASPVRHDSKTIGLEGFLIDTTDRKRAEDNIRRSEAEIEAIYDSAPLMMCLVNREHRVERMNRAMIEFAGVKPAPGSPQAPGDLLGCVNALDDPRGCGFGSQCGSCPLRLATVKTFETGEPCRQIEAGLLLFRGGVRREIQVSASTALVRLQDQPRVLVCLEDITGRKQLEAQFLQAQKMEAVGQLAGGVAHDYNNILAATMLHLQLLQMRQNLDPDLASSLRELEQGAQRAASLTRQLLLFSRRQVLQTKRVDLNEVIQGLMKMLRRLLGEDIEKIFSAAPEPVWVEADVGMLEQVVMNLSINARDAMPGGGRLTLATQRLSSEAKEPGLGPEARPGQFACLTVTDTGCGMDEATLKRVFEPFFTTKEPGKGTGLGLATVQSIVTQHRGRVEVESAVGRGTTFRVFLPAAELPAAAQIQARQADNRGGTETILVIEDDDNLRRLVRMILSRLGYEILEASNSVEAMRVWEQKGDRVSLVFADMVLPGGSSGLALSKRLRQFNPGLKVVITSGYAAELLQQGGVMDAGVQFLAKPYEPASLARTVRKCLDGKGQHG